ncbi:MAG TPA: hypothetical protein V6C65_36610 [Allocoleopsis sp.]
MYFAEVCYWFNGEVHRDTFGLDRRCNISVHLGLQARHTGAVLTAIHWLNSNSIAA